MGDTNPSHQKHTSSTTEALFYSIEIRRTLRVIHGADGVRNVLFLVTTLLGELPKHMKSCYRIIVQYMS